MIRIRVVTADSMQEQCVELPEGSTLGDALAQVPALGEGHAVGIWGRVMPMGTVLRDGDRLESYAPLRADPKAARRRKVDRSNRPGGKF